MSSHDIEQTVLRTVQAAAPARHVVLTPATSLSAVGIGSVGMLELATKLEDELHIQLPIERFARSRTVAELIGVVTASYAQE